MRSRSRLGVIVLAAFLTWQSQADPALAGSGELDPTFGTGGIASAEFGGPAMAYAEVVQPDGRIVTAGFAEVHGDYDFALARYNADGSLDERFGSGGLVRTGFGEGSYDIARALVLQRDGKLVAVGGSASGATAGFALARYNIDGSLDTGFGSGGRVLSSVDGSAYTATIQPSGRIVAAGSSNTGDFALAGYTVDGHLDPAFGSGGLVHTDLGGADHATALATDAGGRIVVAGDSDRPADGGSVIAVARYTSAGVLDPGFGKDGVVRTQFGPGSTDGARALAIQPDGRILAAGASNARRHQDTDFALARYDADGTLDRGFGENGTVLTGFGAGSSDVATALALQPGGRIIAAGAAATGIAKIAVARYDGAGRPDPSFGSGGTASASAPSGGDAAAFGVAVQPHRGIVTAGYAGRSAFLLARFRR